MKKEIKSILGKATKIACITCVAAGAIAVMTSGIALKVIGEGGKYMVNTVKRIVNEGKPSEEDGAVTDEDIASPNCVPAKNTI